MKTISIIALIGSAMCVTLSLIENDWTEAMAWIVITLYNISTLLKYE